MEHQNSNNDDSLAKLLKIAQQGNKKERKIDKTDVFQFIEEFNLEPGYQFVENAIIYYLYKKWKKTRVRHRHSFFMLFSLKFKRMYKNKKRGYKLNKILNITEEEAFTSRKELRDEYVKRKKKKAESKTV